MADLVADNPANAIDRERSLVVAETSAHLGLETGAAAICFRFTFKGHDR